MAELHNVESTSLTAFGLVEALIRELVKSGGLTRAQMQAIYQSAADGFPDGPKHLAAKEMLRGIASGAWPSNGRA